MKTILAFFGRKYVKNICDSKFHHYKCHELNGIHNKKTYNRVRMMTDLARHPYTLTTCKCLEEIV